MAGFEAEARSGDTSLASFAGPPPRRAWWTDCHPGGSQVVGRGFPTDAGFSLDPPQGPSQAAQGGDLLFLFFAQDSAHLTEPKVSVSMS
jgi:hypothetical protein